MTSELKTSSIYLQVFNSTIHYATSLLSFKPQLEFYPQFRNANTEKQHMFWNLFKLLGHSTWEPTSSRETYFIFEPTQEPVLATANTEKTRENFGKNAGEWTGSVESSKEEIPGSSSKRSMCDSILT